MTIPALRRSRSPGTGRTVRAGWRGACAVFGLLVLLVPAFPAAAGDIGDVYSPGGLSLPLKVLLYGGVPLLGFIIGGALSYRPQKGASRRYRPGKPWTYEPVWFGDESALEYEPKRAALPGAGGASGRW